MLKNIVLVICTFLAVVCVHTGYGYSAEQATVFSVIGNATVVPSGSNIGSECVKGMAVNPGDWVKTGPNALVTLAFDKSGENVIKIEENSLVIVKLDGYFKMQLLSGGIYAVLENVQEGETFRVLTPSVVTESMSSGWGANTDGTFTNVVVFNDKVYVCGINQDGSINEKKYIIEEGQQRKTVNFEEPGAIEPIEGDLLSWFTDLVVAHHVEQEAARQFVPPTEDAAKSKGTSSKRSSNERKAVKSTKGKNVVVVDGEEVNLIEYLYQRRTRREKEKSRTE